MDKKWWIYGLFFVAGVVAANKVRSFPVASRLPSI